jgi:hypothetical protein
VGVLEDASQLLAESESIQKNRRAGMLLGKAVLLQAATEACVDSVSTRDWEHARHKLACVLIDVVNLIADLPDSGKD